MSRRWTRLALANRVAAGGGRQVSGSAAGAHALRMIVTASEVLFACEPSRGICSAISTTSTSIESTY